MADFARRKILDLHVHPVMVHISQAFERKISRPATPVMPFLRRPVAFLWIDQTTGFRMQPKSSGNPMKPLFKECSLKGE